MSELDQEALTADERERIARAIEDRSGDYDSELRRSIPAAAVALVVSALHEAAEIVRGTGPAAGEPLQLDSELLDAIKAERRG